MEGIAKVNYGERAGIIHHQKASNHSFLYTTSLIKDAKWNVGDRYVMGDGRVFRYAKAGNIVNVVKFGLKFYDRLANGIAYTALLQTQAIGDTSIKVDAGAAGCQAKDALRGGYVTFHVDYTTSVRGIVGNTLADADGYVTIYLDAPLTVAMTTADRIEVLRNPYIDLRLCAGPSGGLAGNDYTSVAGLPNVTTAKANQYLWIQTWGPCFVNPHGSSLQAAGKTGGEQKVVFDLEGSICIETDVNHGGGADTVDHQVAGFLIDRCANLSNGANFIMLTISP